MTILRRCAFPALAALLSLTAACSSTRIESAVAPDAAGRVFHRLLVIPLFADPAREKAAEEAYRRALEGWPVEVLAASEAIPAGIGEDAFYELLARHGVDGVLVLGEGQVGAVKGDAGDYHTGRDLDYHPNSCDAKLLTWVYNKPGDQLNEAEIAKPWLDMTVTLLDTASRRSVWKARTRTQGTQGTPFAQLVRTQADAAVARLARDGMVEGVRP